MILKCVTVYSTYYKFLHTDVNIYHTNGYRHYWKPDYNTFERIKTWLFCFCCNTIRWAVIHNIVQHDIRGICKMQYKKSVTTKDDEV